VLELFTQTETYISLFSLIAMEIVLGVDNIIFISILAGKLPAERRNKARTIGLSVALISRLILLFSLSWLISLTKPLIKISQFNLDLSGKDLVLLAGGLFLIAKSSQEIYEKVEGHEAPGSVGKENETVKVSMKSIVLQIVIIDTIFSLDSIITAVGMVPNIAIMVLAILVSLVVMMFASQPIGDFIDEHPSIKILALSFLMMIGMMLIAEALGVHIPKGYLYFALVYSLVVEMLNLRLKKKA
jgi:predicted tellurium resistance membrane protein TerC